MYKLIMSVIVFFVFFGCQDVVKPEKPENLISEDTMVSILTESYLINAARSFDFKTLRDKGIKLDSFIYKKFNVDSVQFAESNAYYTADLNRYNKIFVKVEEQLLQIQKRVDSLGKIAIKKRTEQRRKDSLEGKPLEEIVLPIKDSITKKGFLIESKETDVNQKSLK
jgi:hypothetical protein